MMCASAGLGMHQQVSAGRHAWVLLTSHVLGPRTQGRRWAAGQLEAMAATCRQLVWKQSMSCCHQAVLGNRLLPLPTRTWHARRRRWLPGALWGGKLSRSRSWVVQACGSTGPRISTAHVPQVPSPRQLIRVARPLCGVTPAWSIAVRRVAPPCACATAAAGGGLRVAGRSPQVATPSGIPSMGNPVECCPSHLHTLSPKLDLHCGWSVTAAAIAATLSAAVHGGAAAAP